jgi:hypothetical protein
MDTTAYFVRVLGKRMKIKALIEKSPGRFSTRNQLTEDLYEHLYPRVLVVFPPPS